MLINNTIKQFLQINVINIFIITICICAKYFGGIGYIIFFISLVPYCIYILCKDEYKIILYQLYLLVAIEFLVDFLFQYTSFPSPLELKYLIDFLSFIILLKIIKNREAYRAITKDKIFWLLFISIVFNIILFFLQENTLLEFLNALRIYYRFIPVYIVISCRKFNFIKTYNFLYYLNLFILLAQVCLGTHQDMRNGLFGLVGAHTFAIFISIKSIFQTISFSTGKITLYKFLSTFAMTIVILALVENKSFIVILTICIAIIILLNHMKFYKKILLSFTTIIVILLGANLLVKLYPNFSYMLSLQNLQHNITDYIFGNSNPKNYIMGRYDALIYISNIENESLTESFFGNGLGYSIPQENWFYLNGKKGENVLDFPKSTIYNKYDNRFGYHLSSYNYLYLDCGIIGVLFIVSLIMINLLRSIRLLINNQNLYTKSIAGVGILISISAIYICGYAGGLINRTYMYLLFICLGLVTNLVINSSIIEK